MKNFYKKFVHTGDLCFDIGANIGERTDVFLKLGASVIAVEPQNSCCNTLRRKYSNNTRVEVVQCAVGNIEGEAELMICDETDECSTLSNNFVSAYSNVSGFSWRTTEKVQVTTLESLCKQFGIPKLCKIDVEGYESEVFLGLKSRIRFICFEFNRPLLADTLRSLTILGLLGNFRCNFIKYELMDLLLDEWLPLQAFKDKLEQLITPDMLTGEIVVECLD